MADSDLSASELRRRYHRGGTVTDDNLSSAQLRARYAIPANPKDFSTSTNSEGGSLMMIVLVLVVLAAIGGIAYFAMSK